MSTFTAGQRQRTAFQIVNADLVGPIATEQTAFDDGTLAVFCVIIQDTIATGGTLQLQAGGVNVPGALITVPNGAAKGTTFVAQIPFSDVASVTKHSRVSVVPAGFSGAGRVNGHFAVATQSRPASLP